jgi:hypothetical protein
MAFQGRRLMTMAQQEVGPRAPKKNRSASKGGLSQPAAAQSETS